MSAMLQDTTAVAASDADLLAQVAIAVREAGLRAAPTLR